MELIKIESSVFLEMDKHELKAIGENAAIKELKDGDVTASESLILGKKLIEILSGYIGALHSSTIDELYNLGGKQSLKLYGSEISLGSTGNRLDYEKDPEYSRLKKELKEREKWLKEASNSKDEVVVNGAIVEPVPIKSASKEMLRVKL